MAFSCSQTAYAEKVAKEKKIIIKRINVKKIGKNKNEWVIISTTVENVCDQYGKVSIAKHTRAGRGLKVPRNAAFNIVITHAGPAANGTVTVTAEEAAQLKSLSISDNGQIKELRDLQAKKKEEQKKREEEQKKKDAQEKKDDQKINDAPDTPLSQATPRDKPEEKK